MEKGSPLLEEEIFGPLLPIVSYDTDQELMDLLEPLDSPLALPFSEDTDFIEDLPPNFPPAVSASTTPQSGFKSHLPFGGVGASGMGRHRGKWGIEQFTYARAFTRRYMVSDPFELKPPYGNIFSRMRRSDSQISTSLRTLFFLQGNTLASTTALVW